MPLRSGGSGSTWVNGLRVSNGHMTREGVRVDSSMGSSEVKITLPSGVDSIRLKPGQKIDVATGAVLDAFEHRKNETSRSAFDTPGAAKAEAVEVGGISRQDVEKGLDALKGRKAQLKQLLGGS